MSSRRDVDSKDVMDTRNEFWLFVNAHKNRRWSTSKRIVNRPIDVVMYLSHLLFCLDTGGPNSWAHDESAFRKVQFAEILDEVGLGDLKDLLQLWIEVCEVCGNDVMQEPMMIEMKYTEEIFHACELISDLMQASSDDICKKIMRWYRRKTRQR